MRPAFGDWRSLVAHFVRDEGVGGSNPLSPTKLKKSLLIEQAFLRLRQERSRTSGGRGSIRAERENVALATARRASREAASHPLSPTNFKKPAHRAGFFAFTAGRSRTSGEEQSSLVLLICPVAELTAGVQRLHDSRAGFFDRQVQRRGGSLLSRLLAPERENPRTLRC